MDSGLTDSEEQDIALEAYAEAERTAQRIEPRAKTATYLAASHAIQFELTNGCLLEVPIALLPIPQDATPAQYAQFRLDDDGEHVDWFADEHGLDAGFNVAGAILHILGGKDVWRFWSDQWGKRVEEIEARLRAEWASKGGKAKSPAKAKAARENGKKGGRPRKTGAA